MLIPNFDYVIGDLLFRLLGDNLVIRFFALVWHVAPSSRLASTFYHFNPNCSQAGPEDSFIQDSFVPSCLQFSTPYKKSTREFPVVPTLETVWETWQKLCSLLSFHSLLQFQVKWLLSFIDDCFLHFRFMSWNVIEEVCTLQVYATTGCLKSHLGLEGTTSSTLRLLVLTYFAVLTRQNVHRR